MQLTSVKFVVSIVVFCFSVGVAVLGQCEDCAQCCSDEVPTSCPQYFCVGSKTTCCNYPTCPTSTTLTLSATLSNGKFAYTYPGSNGYHCSGCTGEGVTTIWNQAKLQCVPIGASSNAPVVPSSSVPPPKAPTTAAAIVFTSAGLVPLPTIAQQPTPVENPASKTSEPAIIPPNNLPDNVPTDVVVPATTQFVYPSTIGIVQFTTSARATAVVANATFGNAALDTSNGSSNRGRTIGIAVGAALGAVILAALLAILAKTSGVLGAAQSNSTRPFPNRSQVNPVRPGPDRDPSSPLLDGGASNAVPAASSNQTRTVEFGGSNNPLPGQQLDPMLLPLVLPPGGDSEDRQPHWFFVRVATPLKLLRAISVPFQGPSFDVKIEFAPSRQDEIPLNFGSKVEIQRVFRDGWGFGQILNIGRFGMFPLDCIQLPNAPFGSTPTSRDASLST
ncbi:hypothetical protein M427DRAFT_456741 [Gonapodya prolifera JEL478]|uniref:SH3 domain-containing protein n=1 Tax=Gonapodya prolifera (strain JEL478) TaxID=1344416 RepID=A0A139A353_GONPJ|nr:hypothetical protein M427DRAFT_456741 [Gonapodya prolifera JEL478]|eukprot:KXS11058.1 hypothetical protein M427DRAFT_456741 [Gonapodya prolifera JEL478]